jgi:prepilin-type N-terminal cleavage/methylation domain-containing protein
MNNRAFTLIELLVVISIIGVISSVSLAAFGTAREKARKSAALMFDTNLYHSQGINTSAMFHFYEGTDSKATDSSGNAKTMTLSSSGLWDNSDSISTYALKFNGTSDWAVTPDITMNGVSEAVSVWVKTSAPSNPIILGQNYRRRLYASYWVFSYSGIYDYLNFSKPINDGKWHNVAYSISNGKAKAYVDGNLSGTMILTGTLTSNTEPWQLGGNLCSGNFCTVFTAESIDDFRIYNQAFDQ